MAKRLSIKEILEAARSGGPATPDAAPDEAPVQASAPSPSAPPPPPAAPPASAAPSAATLGRPLTLKEKLAAARAGGSTPPPAAAKAAPAPVETVEAEAAAEPAAAPAVAAPAAPLGRPMTLQEKLAAARGGAKPAAAPAAGAKPAAAAKAAPAAKSAARALPPIGELSDPRDLAEALRQTGAKKDQEVAAKIAAAKPPAKVAPPKPTSVLPKPDRATATGGSRLEINRRGVLLFLTTPVVIAWTAFTLGTTAFTVMMGRFMFPNVLAEPPSTVKVGLPTNFDPEDVNERFKTEWGFWIVRSTKYNGQDIIYAIQTVCTHLGCPPNWLAGEQKFKCPCHGSGYYITGVNFEGPAPRPLERFKVTLADDGQIMVDKSQHFQEELGQWTDPDSFITV